MSISLYGSDPAPVILGPDGRPLTRGLELAASPALVDRHGQPLAGLAANTSASVARIIPATELPASEGPAEESRTSSLAGMFGMTVTGLAARAMEAPAETIERFFALCAERAGMTLPSMERLRVFYECKNVHDMYHHSAETLHSVESAAAIERLYRLAVPYLGTLRGMLPGHAREELEACIFLLVKHVRVGTIPTDDSGSSEWTATSEAIITDELLEWLLSGLRDIDPYTPAGSYRDTLIAHVALSCSRSRAGFLISSLDGTPYATANSGRILALRYPDLLPESTDAGAARTAWQREVPPLPSRIGIELEFLGAKDLMKLPMAKEGEFLCGTESSYLEARTGDWGVDISQPEVRLSILRLCVGLAMRHDFAGFLSTHIHVDHNPRATPPKVFRIRKHKDRSYEHATVPLPSANPLTMDAGIWIDQMMVLSGLRYVSLSSEQVDAIWRDIGTHDILGTGRGEYVRRVIAREGLDHLSEAATRLAERWAIPLIGVDNMPEITFAAVVESLHSHYDIARAVWVGDTRSITTYFWERIIPSRFAEIEEFFRDGRIHDYIKIRILFSDRLLPLRFSEVEAFLRDENVSIDVRVEVAMNTKTIDGSAGVSSFISDTKIPQEIRMIFVRGFVRWGSAITLAEIAPILKEPGIRETVVSFLVHEAHSNPWFILGETMPIFRDPSISISTKECIMGLVHIGSASTDIGKFMRDEEIPGSMKRRLIERLSWERHIVETMAFTDVEGFLRDPEAHISLREWAAQKIVPPSIRDVEAFLRDATIDESIRKAVAARTRIEKPAEILPLLDDERVSGQIRTTLIRTLFASANKIEFAEIAPLFRISEVAKLFSRMLVFWHFGQIRLEAMIPVLKNPYIDPHVKDEAMEYVYVDAEADIGAFMRDPEISGRWKYELMCRIWRQHADRPAIYWFRDFEGFLRDPEVAMRMREWVARRIMPMSYRKVEAFLRDKAVPENLKDIISSLVLR